MDSENILIWNVRGLNDRARRDALGLLVATERVSLLCIQETKLAAIGDRLIMQMLGSSFEYAYLPASRTRGGVLVAWRRNIWTASQVHLSQNAVTLKISLQVRQFHWWLTSVYGPPRDLEKVSFLQELRDMRACRHGD